MSRWHNWVPSSGGWVREEQHDNREVILHLVRYSSTLCGIPTYELEDTSALKHRWTGTRDDDAGYVNCQVCKKRRPQ